MKEYFKTESWQTLRLGLILAIAPIFIVATLGYFKDVIGVDLGLSLLLLPIMLVGLLVSAAGMIFTFMELANYFRKHN